MKRFGLILLGLVIVAWFLILALPGRAADRPFRWKWRAAVTDCHGHHAGYWYREFYDPPVHHPHVGYTISYDPAAAALIETVDRLTRTVEKQSATVDRLLGASPAVQAPAPLDGLTVLKTSCAACHSETRAKDKGNGFVLIQKDGSLASLSAADRRRITERITTPDAGKRMPPAEALPAAEMQAVASFLAGPPPKAD